MDDKFSQFEDALRIEKTELDQCIEEQAVIFNEVAQACSTAVSMRDGAKKAMEEKFAEIALSIRRTWDEKADGRLTEEGLRQRVLTSRGYKEAQRVYWSAKETSDKWETLKDAWQQRGFMLRLETELYVAGYFAEFVTKGESMEETQVDLLRKRYQNAVKSK